MPLFGPKPSSPSPEQKVRDEQSLESIRSGGLPLNATERLSRQAQTQGSESHLFTSDLSVNELMLTRECGFEPLGQVMGSSVYHVGWQNLPFYSSAYDAQEPTVLTQAQSEVRRLALHRIRQEAELLKADAVVGVRLERKEADLGAGTIEFAAVGTAVRRMGAPPLQGPPFLSALSGQEHWKLREGGYAPRGFCFGTCVWYQTLDWRGWGAMNSWFKRGGHLPVRRLLHRPRAEREPAYGRGVPRKGGRGGGHAHQHARGPCSRR